MSTPSQRKAKKFTPMGIVFAALGLALFAYFVRKAGVSEIVDGIRRLGAGFLLVLLIAFTRKIVRALAWQQCFEAPARIGFVDALTAVLAADSLGTMMPLGMVVSEPTKAALVRHKAPLISGLAAIAVENIFYSFSVTVFVFFGMAALLLSFSLPKLLLIASIGAIVVVVITLIVAIVVMKKQLRFLSGTVEWLYGRGIGKRALEDRRTHVRTLEDRVYGFYSRNRSRFLLILIFEAWFHIAGVLEGYVTLFFIGAAPTLLGAFILESANRVITVAFKFIPFRLGVDEAGSGRVTKLLNLGVISGVTLAIVRKGRDVVFTAIGLLILLAKGLSPARVVEESQIAVAEEVEATE
jgi:hypothetical protein